MNACKTKMQPNYKIQLVSAHELHFPTLLNKHVFLHNLTFCQQGHSKQRNHDTVDNCAHHDQNVGDLDVYVWYELWLCNTRKYNSVRSITMSSGMLLSTLGFCTAGTQIHFRVQEICKTRTWWNVRMFNTLSCGSRGIITA